MADNVTLPGTGVDVAADDVGGALYQRVKIAVGADGAAADLAPGQATMAGSLPVAIASNQSAIPVTDNSGSLTVDSAQLPVALAAGGGLKVEGVSGGVAVSIGGAAADDAAAAGNPVPMGGIYQATVDAVDDGDVGRLRMTSRRALVTAADYQNVLLNAASVTDSPITIGDIGVYNLHSMKFGSSDGVAYGIYVTLVVPMAEAGWRNFALGFLNGATSHDQTFAVQIYAYNGEANGLGLISSFTVPATNNLSFFVSSGGAVGSGGTAGDATVVNKSFYSVPALAGCPHLYIHMSATQPTTGAFDSITIARWT